MEDTVVKKAKAPAKPRKSTKKTETAAVEGIRAVPAPSRDQIEALARRYWEERGWKDGFAEQDWLRAEQELRGIAS